MLQRGASALLRSAGAMAQLAKRTSASPPRVSQRCYVQGRAVGGEAQPLQGGPSESATGVEGTQAVSPQGREAGEAEPTQGSPSKSAAAPGGTQVLSTHARGTEPPPRALSPHAPKVGEAEPPHESISPHAGEAAELDPLPRAPSPHVREAGEAEPPHGSIQVLSPPVREAEPLPTSPLNRAAGMGGPQALSPHTPEAGAAEPPPRGSATPAGGTQAPTTHALGWGSSASPPTARPWCFAAELCSSELVHFALSSEGAPPGEGLRRRPGCFVPPPGRCFSFCIAGISGRVQAARLHRDLRSSLGAGAAGGSGVLPLLRYSPWGGAAPERGFLVQDERRLQETESALQELLRLRLPAPARLRVYEEAADGELWCASWSLKGASESAKELLGQARVLAAEPPELHPAVPHLLGSAVFGSLQAARQVLQECMSLIPEAKAVLDLVEKYPEHPKKGDFPVIVIEGLDATGVSGRLQLSFLRMMPRVPFYADLQPNPIQFSSAGAVVPVRHMLHLVVGMQSLRLPQGKTTVTQSLKDSLNAVLLRSPPSCVNQWRKIFDEEPTLIRRAFYAVTNYIVASEIAQASMKSPVIIDRYWHSTAAYAIATEISGKVEDLPPLHHQVYQWPEDLLRPDVVLMLTLSPEERIRRLQGRGMEKTKEEAELEASSVFRQKVEESYKRMENPICHPVDASPSREEVLKATLHLIKKQCPLL